MYTSLPRVPNLKRYRCIAMVLARHGFGSFLERLQLTRRISLPRTLLKQAVATRLSPAEHLRLALEELGPTFVKLGQILSTRPDLIPPDFIVELSKLTDAVPPAAWEDVRSVLRVEFGDEPEQIFAYIDPVPLAAASLSQVHAATLKESDQVVVKIQRPNILTTIETDLEILSDLAALAQRTSLGELYNPKDVIEEFAFTLNNELDYQREGRNADRFRANFTAEDHLYIPRIYWEYTTRRVLVMERIHGIRIDDLAALDDAGYDRRIVAHHSARIIIQEVLQDGFFHADPHAGNFIVMPGEVIGAMDFGMVGHLSECDRLNLIRLYITAMSLDANRIVEQLVHMNIAGTSVDQPGLARQINRLLSKYYGLPLKEIRAREIIEEVMPVAFQHHVHLPADFWLLTKTVAMMEGVGLQLDPDFDIFTVSEPFVKRLKQQMWLPNRQWGETLLRQGVNWAELLDLIPQSGRRLLEKAERGELFEVNLKDTARILSGLDRLVMRLSLSILVAAFVVSLALLIPVTSGGSLVQALVVAGFVITIGLGIWLLISILRTKR